MENFRCSWWLLVALLVSIVCGSGSTDVPYEREDGDDGDDYNDEEPLFDSDSFREHAESNQKARDTEDMVFAERLMHMASMAASMFTDCNKCKLIVRGIAVSGVTGETCNQDIHDKIGEACSAMVTDGSTDCVDTYQGLCDDVASQIHAGVSDPLEICVAIGTCTATDVLEEARAEQAADNKAEEAELGDEDLDGDEEHDEEELLQQEERQEKIRQEINEKQREAKEKKAKKEQQKKEKQEKKLKKKQEKEERLKKEKLEKEKQQQQNAKSNTDTKEDTIPPTDTDASDALKETEARKQRKEDKNQGLPTCDKARKFYEKKKLYKVLGLKKKATTKEIKKHYKKMAVQCHPDKNQDNEDAEANFVAISGAYQTLSDDQERRIYDSGMKSGSSGWNHAKDVNVNDILKNFFGDGGRGSQRGGGGGGGFQYSFNSNSGGDDDMFSNMFKNFQFGTRSQAGATRRTMRRNMKTVNAGFGDNVDDLLQNFGGGSFSGSFGQQPTIEKKKKHKKDRRTQKEKPKKKKDKKGKKDKKKKNKEVDDEDDLSMDGKNFAEKFAEQEEQLKKMFTDMADEQKNNRPKKKEQKPKSKNEKKFLKILQDYHAEVAPKTTPLHLERMAEKYLGRESMLYNRLEKKYGMHPLDYM